MSSQNSGGEGNFEGFSFNEASESESNPLLDYAREQAFSNQADASDGQVEQVSDRAGATVNYAQQWEGTKGAANVSCDAYCRSVNPETPSYVDSSNSQAGYFGGGPEQRVAQRPMSEAELYQLQRQQRHERQQSRAGQWQDPRTRGWDQGRQPVQNDGQTIVNISKGGSGNQGYNGYGGWGNGGWNQGSQGDSTTIVTSGGQEVSTGSDDIQYGDFGHSKSRTEVGGRIVAGNGNGSGIDNPTYNDETARILGIGKVAERIGSVITGNDNRNNGDIYNGGRYGSNGRRDIPWNGGYNGGRRGDIGSGGRNTTIIVNGGGEVSTGSDDIRYGDFEYGKQRTEVGTPPFFPNGQPRGTGHRGSRSGIDNPTYNDQTARWLGIGKVIERNIGAWKK